MADAVLMARRCLSANLQDAQDAQDAQGKSSLENEISQSRRLKIKHGIMGIFLDFNQGHSSYVHVAMGAMDGYLVKNLRPEWA